MRTKDDTYIPWNHNKAMANNKIPVILAIWFPNLILLLSTALGIFNINEK